MFIKRNKMGIKETKQLENLIANADKIQAFMDYIAVCDHPEILEESEVESNEQSDL